MHPGLERILPILTTLSLAYAANLFGGIVGTSIGADPKDIGWLCEICYWVARLWHQHKTLE